MAMMSRCVALLFASVGGARVARKRASAGAALPMKFIAGVPVLNYHTAYGGVSLEQDSEQEQEWVIVVKPGTTDAEVERMCKTNKAGCNLVGHATGGVPFVELRGTERDLEAVLSAAAGAARYVEPDTEMHMIPELEADNVEAATWGLTRIGADTRVRSGAGVTVFVLDTGVRTTHQEFTGRGSPALDMSSGAPVECKGDLSCAKDKQGHGTHCAGSAVGKTFGVAPSAALGSIKVLSDSGSGSWSWSYSALDWLATGSTRPAVASMSLGGRGNQQAMKDAVDAAVNAGVVVVVAAGNENSNACNYSPAFVPSAVTVGSTTSRDARSSFSNYGACVDIWAPGSDVLSASHRSDTGSAKMSGTSMACPHVSGGAALVLEANPNMKAVKVVARLQENGVKGALTGLKRDDTNVLLYVAEGGAPPTPPTPAPPAGECAWYCSLCVLEQCINNCDFCQ